MFGNLKAIIQFIKLLLETYQFIDGQISEYKYTSAVNKRKENYKRFMSGNRSDRLDVLAEENNED